MVIHKDREHTIKANLFKYPEVNCSLADYKNAYIKALQNL